MKYNYILITLLLGIISFTSCNDVWLNHYENTGINSKLSMYDYIKTQPDLSTFAGML